MNRLYRTGTALSLFMLVAVPLAARAQIGQATVNAAAGLSLATGSFGDRNDAGYALQLGVGFAPPASPLSFRVEGMFNEFNQNLGGGKSRAAGITGNAIFGVPMAKGAMFIPYAIGGVGYYNTRQPIPLFDAESRSDFGWNLGGGVRFPLSGFSAYVEARYHSVSNVSVQFAPIVFGVVF